MDRQPHIMANTDGSSGLDPIEIKKIDPNVLENGLQESQGVQDGLASPIRMKKLLRKTDLHVVPPLFVIFLLAFLDRTNIGNAYIQGLPNALNLVDNQYNIALMVFFIPYILLEIPSNIMMKRMAPSSWLSLIIIGFGMKILVMRVGCGIYTEHKHRRCYNWPRIDKKLCRLGRI